MNEGDCSKYGRLYNWTTAVGKSEDDCGYGKRCNLGDGKVRGVCPKGWHLPDTTEWNALFTAVGGKEAAGTKLKSTDGWNEKEDGTSGNGSDDFDFSVLPAGNKGSDGKYNFQGDFAVFWSSTERNNVLDSTLNSHLYGANAYDVGLVDKDGYAYLGEYYKFYFFSVRCLKD